MNKVLIVLNMLLLLGCSAQTSSKSTYKFNDRVNIIGGFYEGCFGLVNQSADYDNDLLIKIYCNTGKPGNTCFSYITFNWINPKYLTLSKSQGPGETCSLIED